MSSPSKYPASPCVARCSTALGDEICRGCGRSFIEVANWVLMTEEEKEAVWLRLERQSNLKLAADRDERQVGC